MAFKMNRPTIKGTANHKASIAKAKEKSIVSQRRTQADASLVSAGKTMGESYIPAAIDYSIDQKGIEFLDIKKERGKGKGKGKTKKGSNETKVGSTAETYTGGFEEDNSNIKAPDVDYKKPKSDVRVITPKELKNKDKKKKVKKEKQPKVKKDTFYNDVDKDGNVISRGYQSIKDKIKAKREQKELDFQAAKSKNLNERLKRAEEGPDSDYDFSQIDNEPSAKTRKAEKYKSPETDTKEGEELLSRTKASRNKALQDAAKKYNVKVEDLEAKEIGGKREFFPKQDVVGGKEETQWDDKLGRFRKPEATIPVGKEEQEKAVQEMKPKYPKGMDPNLATTGEIALNYDTNTYEYTQQYYDRLAKEKIEQQKVEPTSTTTKPVVEEKKTLSNLEIRKKKAADKKYNNPKTSQYIKDQMIKEGYVPNESKSPTQARDNRIYRNAIKGGAVQRNMIKSGYKPE